MRAQRKEISDEIPTSSTADVAFLLVVYFMLMVTFSATRGLDFKLPHDDDQAAVVDPIESVLVEVAADGSLQVDRRPLELAQLLAYLAPKLAQDPLKPVIVRSHAEAPYGAMVAVLDELRQGKERLGLGQEIVIAIPTEREIGELWG